jgi:hypothetical protein
MSIPTSDIPEKFMNKVPIYDEHEALKLLNGSSTKFTEQSLCISGSIAWIKQEVFGREVGFHQGTNYYLVDRELAERLIEGNMVAKKWHPPEYGGSRIELTEMGEKRLHELASARPAPATK